MILIITIIFETVYEKVILYRKQCRKEKKPSKSICQFNKTKIEKTPLYLFLQQSLQVSAQGYALVQVLYTCFSVAVGYQQCGH